MVAYKPGSGDGRRIIRILHLTDTHIDMSGDTHAGMPGAQRRRIATFVEALAEDIHGKRIDMVSVTGDIAFSGLQEEYQNFEAWVIKPMSCISELSSATWCVVPGNHDIDFAADYADQNAILKYSENKIFTSGDTGRKARSPLLNRFAAFKTFSANFPATNATSWLEQDGYFDIVIPIPLGLTLRVIGLNTAWCENRPTRAGEKKPILGGDLLASALKRDKPATLTLVLGHHPLALAEPEERNEISALLASKGLVYLAGHEHHIGPCAHVLGDSMFLTLVANAVDPHLSPETNPKSGYLWLEYDADKRKFSFFPRILEDGSFVLDATSTPGLTREEDGFALSSPEDYRQKFAALRTLGWSKPLEGAQSSPTAEDWQDFIRLGQPTFAIAARLAWATAPVGEAVRILADPGRSGGRAVRLEAPLGEGLSTVFQQICIAMAEDEWTVWVQGDGHKLPAGIPEDITKGGRHLLALRKIGNAADCLALASLINAIISGRHKKICILCEIDYTFLSSSDNPLNASYLSAAVHTVTWAIPGKGGCWIKGTDQPLALHGDWAQLESAGLDETIPLKPHWSLLGGRAQLAEDAGSDATLRDGLQNRLKMHIQAWLGPPGKDRAHRTAGVRALGIIAAVHGAGKAILTREVLASALFADDPSTGSGTPPDLEPDILSPLMREIRKVDRDGTEVLLVRHPALGRALAKAIGGDLLAKVVRSTLKLHTSGNPVPFWTDWIELVRQPADFKCLFDWMDWTTCPLAELDSLALAWEARNTTPQQLSSPGNDWRQCGIDLYSALAVRHHAVRHQEDNVPRAALFAVLATLLNGVDNFAAMPFDSILPALEWAEELGFATESASEALGQMGATKIEEKRVAAMRDARIILHTITKQLAPDKSDLPWMKVFRQNYKDEFLRSPR
jgi:hypothetical protein